MRLFTIIIFSVLAAGCASSALNYDRNNNAWATTIVGCESAADLIGTDSDRKAWAYERRALLADRNGGWPSDHARLSLAVDENKKRLLSSDEDALPNQLSNCRSVLAAAFPHGHPTQKS